ncbi:MAG: glycosyltransferase [Candidatus Riflebacteria bacterium]|nr:glycosyltransferase [Candidatus Riflebacteria bacterium]
MPAASPVSGTTGTPAGRRLRVLLTGHLHVNRLNRRKLDFLAADPGLEVHLLVPHHWRGSVGDEYWPAREPFPDGYTQHVHRVLFEGQNRLHLYVYRPGLRRLLSRISPDIVHVEEEPYSLGAFQLAFTLQSLGKPFLFTSYQNLLKRYPPPFRQMERYVLRRAIAATVGSEANVQVLRHKGFTGRIARITYGVDPTFYSQQPAERLRERLALDGLVVGYVGRLVPMKGIATLLKACQHLSGPVTTLLIGSGPLEREVEAAVRACGPGQRVVWVKGLVHEEIPRYLSAMDCLVLPSVTTPTIKEQFGRVLLEAMSCEVPVIGSSSGEIPNVIGDAGIVFPEGDHEALARILNDFLMHPSRRWFLGALGRARVVEHYSWETIARDLARLYKELAGGMELARVPSPAA